MPFHGEGGVVLRLSETDDGLRAGVAGLQTCGSVWACPVCARKISARRAGELREVLEAVRAAGGSAAMVTLTMRHNAGQQLGQLWEALSDAWGAVTSGRGWTADQGTFGILGWCRVVEATHGEHGWHLHIHALVVFDAPRSQAMAEEAGHRMFQRWRSALQRRGLTAVEHRGGLDVRMVDMGGASLDRTADYLAKITSEITSPSTKEGRDGNRAPFAILRDALATGLAEDCDLWLSWEKASHNRRQLTWSRNLRDWAGLHVERSDEEIAQEDQHGDDQLIIPPESWPAVRAELAGLLEAAEDGGADGARRWLGSRGLSWVNHGS